MNIYFCGSISGGRQDRLVYAHLIELLKKYGTVFTEHVGVEVLECEVGMSDKDIHDRDVAWLKNSEVVIAEVTQVSMGVGYELGRAIELGKRILCLFRPEPGKQCSPMIAGAHNGDNFIVMQYKEEDACDIFKEFFEKYHSEHERPEQ